jgi:hypothetical protein
MTAAPDNTNVVRRQQIIAIASILVLLIGGAALAWWKFYTPTLDEPLVDIGRGGAGGGQRFGFNPPAPPRDGVRKTAITKNSWELRAADGRMTASQDEKGDWRYGYRYQPVKYRSPGDREFFNAKYRSAALSLTKEQQAQLNALPVYVSEMMASDDDKKKLQDQFQSYLSASDADKPKRDPVLVQGLADVSKRSLEPTLSYADSIIAKVKSILTADQLTKLTQPRTPSAPNTAPPTTSPTSGAPTSGSVR